MSLESELVFYDGGCGMCHAFVSFVVARDRLGAFRFAPLGGETFLEVVPEDIRGSLPDSVVVTTADGRVLVRSNAALHVLARLRGGWRLLALLLRLVPRSVRDLVYDLVASVRRKLFAPPPDVCPVLPPALRERFVP